MPLVPLKTNLSSKQVSHPFHSLRDEMDKLFDSFFTQVPSVARSEHMLDFRIDVTENEKGISVRGELPGVDEKDIDIQLDRDILTIRGEKKSEKEAKEKNYHLVECRYGSFARSIRLPFTPSEEDVKASIRHGVLNVTVARPASEKTAARKIQVKAE